MQKNFGVASASHLHNRHPDGIFVQDHPCCGMAADTSQAGFVGDRVVICKARSADADGNKGGDLPPGPQ